MKKFILFIILTNIVLFAEEKVRIITKEEKKYHMQFYGVWVIHRYLYGSSYDEILKKENFSYYHKHVGKNPKRWLGKRIIIDSEKIKFPDTLKKYDRYHDSRDCSFNIDHCQFTSNWKIATILQMVFENDPAPERIGFDVNDKYLLVQNTLCYDTPFDNMFLINEKELVFSFGAVFFIAKKKGER